MHPDAGPSLRETKGDLAGLADCRRLVDAFYARVLRDALLGPVFAARIEDGSWAAHLERMASFWYTVLFAAPLYHGNPVAKHRGLGVDANHFNRWLELWAASVDQLFQGAQADEAKSRAVRMAQVLLERAGAD